MSVKKKLYGSFFIVILLASGLGLFALRDMGIINQQGNVITDTNIPRIVYAARLNRLVSDYRKFEYMHICSATPREMAEAERYLAEQSKQFDENIAGLEKIAVEEKKAAIRQTWAKWEEYKKISEEIQVLSRANKSAEALAVMKGKSANMNTQLSDELIGYTEFNIKDAEIMAQDGDNLFHTSRAIMIGGLVLMFMFSCGVALYISHYIANSMEKMMRFAKTLSEGDFRQMPRAITTPDEFGALADALVEMRENVRHLVREIVQTAGQVASSSQELTAGAEQSAQVTTQIAQSVDEMAGASNSQVEAVNSTTSAIGSISASIEEVAANAMTSAGQASQAMDTAQEGHNSVQKAMTQMSTIEEAVNSSAEVIGQLGDRSKEIGTIVDTISGIAGQTNLLALNAAIEAARAGEHGKGFAVVAEEVRKLAEQSQEAAQRISDLIGKIQEETQKAVVSMQAGTQEVKTGTQVVNESGEAFEKIRGLADVVAKQVNNIATTVQSVAKESEDIVSSIKVVDVDTKKVSEEARTVSAATEEQSAAMEQIAASSQDLAKMAQHLQTETNKFRI